LQDNGDLVSAEEMLRRGLSISEKTLGAEHPDVATSCRNLGLVLKIKGDITGAKQNFQRSLQIGEKMLGPEHHENKKVQNLLKDCQAPATAKGCCCIC